MLLDREGDIVTKKDKLEEEEEWEGEGPVSLALLCFVGPALG